MSTHINRLVLVHIWQSRNFTFKILDFFFKFILEKYQNILEITLKSSKIYLKILEFNLETSLATLVELVKEGTDKRSGEVWLRKRGKIQGDAWNSYCSEYTMGVFLQKVIWSGWHSLRADWWAYPMLIVLVRGEMGKEAKRIYRFWGGHKKVKFMKALVVKEQERRVSRF